MTGIRSLGWIALFTALTAGCGGSTSGDAPPGGSCSGASCSQAPDPGKPVTVTPSPALNQQELEAKLAEQTSLTADQLLAKRALPKGTALGYDPLKAAGIDLIKASPFGLSAEEEKRLQANGFSLDDTKNFPTFTYGYASIYMADLPVFLSADSLLYAAHQSYDKILARVEYGALAPDVRAMLQTMRGRLSSGSASWLEASARADLDLYLALGLSLLDGELAPVVAGGDAALLADLFGKARDATGASSIRLFGVDRAYDFSQFKPRGHYAEAPILQRYFRALMWFGRTEFRMIETDGYTGQAVFRRRQLEAALGLVELLDDDARQRFARVDQTIGLFVGENDAMTPNEAPKLLADLGISDGGGLAALDDSTIAQKLTDGGHGAQRIASQIAVNGVGGTLPLHRAFQLFGQRYTVDSHVFANVVYDRVNHGGTLRMMPSTFDAAYAAFGNDQAASLLAPELTKYGYAPDLESMRVLVDAHGDEYWKGSLYTLWMSSLRALSPVASELADPKASGLPAVATSEAWGRRVLNTQLASWAELRHDTILYAKQSYSGGATCEFPDAYVDPYPAFYKALSRYCERGKAMVDTLGPQLDSGTRTMIAQHFERLDAVAVRFADMAERQRTGQPFTAEQMAFVNQTVSLEQGCGSPFAQGWYHDLFVSPDDLAFDPTIADVHTQPFDELGNEVGRVLHVATGGPRRMVVTVETCNGPRAYVGLASSYREKVTENYQRMNDEEWAKEAFEAPAPAWMSDLLGP